MTDVIMNDALKGRLQKAQSRMYTGIMTVYDMDTAVVDPVSGISTGHWVILLEDIPCRISYKTVSPNVQDNAGGLQQEIILYCAPDFVVPEGSKISVKQSGVTSMYQLSGKASVYASHQEIPVEVFQQYA